MAISFSSFTGVYEKALHTRIERAEVLANNIANADTPGYKARDLDFKAVMQGAQDDQLKLRQTDSGHLGAGNGDSGELMYRNPIQPSLDGNTVDSQTEIIEYARNASDYAAGFQFLDGRFKSLKSAIRGE